MSKSNSFDIVSEVDVQQIDNAVVQADKEVATRYDFRGTDCSIKRSELAITLLAADDMKLHAMKDILHTKLIKQGISLKFLEYGKEEAASKGYIRQVITIKQGISKEDGKLIMGHIKDSGIKVQPSIQGDQLRVIGKNRDDLQAIIQYLKSIDLPVAISFTNYR